MVHICYKFGDGGDDDDGNVMSGGAENVKLVIGKLKDVRTLL